MLCASVFNAYGEADRGILGEMAFSLSVVALVVGPMHPVVFSAPAKPHSQHSRVGGPVSSNRGFGVTTELEPKLWHLPASCVMLDKMTNLSSQSL